MVVDFFENGLEIMNIGDQFLLRPILNIYYKNRAFRAGHMGGGISE